MYPTAWLLSNAEIAASKNLVPAARSVRFGIPVESVPRGILSDDFINGWNSAADHFRQTPPPLCGRCLVLSA